MARHLNLLWHKKTITMLQGVHMTRFLATVLKHLILLQLFLLCAVFVAKIAHAETVSLPVSVRIVDCTTYEKSATLCKDRNLCCDIAKRQQLELAQSTVRNK